MSFSAIMHQILYISDTSLIAELAERSPIIIQISSNQLSRKNWVYDRTTLRPYKVPFLTCVINCTAGISALRLCPVVQWSVHWAQGRTTRVLVLAGARRCALETYGKKKLRAPLLGLAKSKHYLCNEFLCFYTFLWYKLQSCAPY